MFFFSSWGLVFLSALLLSSLQRCPFSFWFGWSCLLYGARGWGICGSQVVRLRLHIGGLVEYFAGLRLTNAIDTDDLDDDHVIMSTTADRAIKLLTAHIANKCNQKNRSIPLTRFLLITSDPINFPIKSTGNTTTRGAYITHSSSPQIVTLRSLIRTPTILSILQLLPRHRSIRDMTVRDIKRLPRHNRASRATRIRRQV
jgi:hypothetical protein